MRVVIGTGFSFGYSGDFPHIAHMERFLDGKGKLQEFEDTYKAISGGDWRTERDAYEFNQDQVIKALSATIGQSEEACIRWIEGNMRSLGVKSVAVVCICGHESAVYVSGVDGAVEVPTLVDRLRCSACGRRPFHVRPNWPEMRAPGMGNTRD